jgi:phosphatidylglycerol lysyltransferase
MPAAVPDAVLYAAHLSRALELIVEHGWNATCYQILNPGFELWFSEAGDAVVGFVEQYGVRVVGGVPVCSEDRLLEVVGEFESEGGRVCYLAAEERLVDLLRQVGSRHTPMVIGGQPAWDPLDWPRMLGEHASLRAQLNRARNKRVRVEEWPAEHAESDPSLRRCLEDWLHTRGLPPLHFLIESDTLSRLFDRRVFVALQQDEVVGFLVASPIPARGGWLIEQLVRGPGAVNGSTELMLDAAMLALAAAGSRFVTLGLAPLSRFTARANVDQPTWLRMLLLWMRAHGNRFYNFEGLEAYKAKFRPQEWEPVFAIVNEPRIRLSMLYAITAAFAGGPPPTLLLRGVGHALALEAERAVRRVRAIIWTLI